MPTKLSETCASKLQFARATKKAKLSSTHPSIFEMAYGRLRNGPTPDHILKRRRAIRQRFQAVLEAADSPLFFNQIRLTAAGGNEILPDKMDIGFGEGVEILSEMQEMGEMGAKIKRHSLPGTAGRRCQYSIEKGGDPCPQ